jgi:hypothetical protein
VSDHLSSGFILTYTDKAGKCYREDGKKPRKKETKDFLTTKYVEHVREADPLRGKHTKENEKILRGKDTDILLQVWQLVVTKGKELVLNEGEE